MSIQMKVTVKGKEYIEKVKLAGSKIPSALQNDLFTAMSAGFEVAYNVCPVRTGYLRSTIQFFVQGLRGVLEATAHYAGFVEFGTRRMAARPFIRTGGAEAAARFLQLVRELPRRIWD